MILDFSPTPEFSTCSTKIFIPKELHVTRKYDRSVLILMMDGTLSFIEDGKKITLERGEYYIQRQGLLQEGIPLNEPPIYFYIEFNGYFSEGNNGLPLRGSFEMEKFVGLMDGIEALFTKHRANLFLLNSYMYRIFSELLEHSPSFDDKTNTAQLIKNYIDSRYSSPIKLADIGKQFGYAEDYIVRIFRETYGITPHKYLISIRLEHARWLLENTDKSAEEIAFSVGYNDFSAFFRAFRSAYGASPSIIRAELQQKRTDNTKA